MFGSAASGGVRAATVTAGVAVLVTVAVLAGPAWAETLTVDTAADEQNTNGQCSLREAIINANANGQSGSADCVAGTGEDAINFDSSLSGPQTITLAEPLPAVPRGEVLTVDGTDSEVTISGNKAVRVFEVAAGATLALEDLTIADGNGAPGRGGGVLNLGTLRVDGSTFFGNTAPSGGAIANSGSATVKRSTLSGNTASGSGGALHNQGTLAVTGSTLWGNAAASGEGIEHAGGSAVLRSTIVADRASGGNCHASASPITDGGYNLSSDDTCDLTAAKRSGIDPELGPLADNGGPTQTHALLGRSPAVDRGRSFGVGADQRGLPRPTDLGEFGNARGGDGSDIGAYEQVRCSGDVVNAAGTIVGTPGNDSEKEALKGTESHDFIFGLGGNDTIYGGGGDDKVCSGKGNDAIYGGDGDDKLLGGEGKDKLQGGDDADRLEGLLGDDRLNTEDEVQGNDEAYGGTGQDYCRRTDPGDKKVSCR